jgi:hypothetical protein
VHRVGDVGELREREVALARFDCREIGGRYAEASGDLGLGQPERLAVSLSSRPTHLGVNIGYRSPRHRLYAAVE